MTAINEFVFVYGTLRLGGSNAGYLAEAEFLGAAETVDLYSLYVDRLSGLPHVVEKASTKIAGELYCVSSELLIGALDELEEHPDFYRRKLVSVITNVAKHDAWMYIWPHSVTDSFEFVESGDFARELDQTRQNSPRPPPLPSLTQ